MIKARGMKPQSVPSAPTTPPATPSDINNPIVLLNTFPALVETSIINQDTTILSIEGSAVNSISSPTSNFTLIVNIVIYAPGVQVDPMAVFDTTPAQSNGEPSASRIYRLLFQKGFGKNQNAYQQAMFYLNGIPPVDGPLVLTIKHPPCKRRIITVDQFANLAPGLAEDQQATRQALIQGTIQITSGLTATTAAPYELVYGAVAIGRNFDQYSDPEGFIPIQNVGSNIDSFDATLKTYYQLTSSIGTYGLSALISNSAAPIFVWSAAVQTFKSFALKG